MLKETLKQTLRQTIKLAWLIGGDVFAPLEARTYKIATVAPDGLGWIKDLRQAFKTIDAETEGRVKFKLYPGGVQGDDFTVVRKCASANSRRRARRRYADPVLYRLTDLQHAPSV